MTRYARATLALFALTCALALGLVAAAPARLANTIHLANGDEVWVTCQDGTLTLQAPAWGASGGQIMAYCGGPRLVNPTVLPTTTTTAPTQPPAPTVVVPPPSASRGLWLSPAELAALPMSGSGWDAVKSAAQGSWGSPKLADLNSNHDVYTLAGALYAARSGDSGMRAKVQQAILSAIGTEAGTRSLEVSRNIVSYVIAADLIGGVGSDETRFRSWLSALRTREFDGRSIVSTHEDRPNNWGTMAGAARVAIDRYLGDSADLARAWAVFQGWAGNRAAYAGFAYGETSWQCPNAPPVGVNPPCSKDGHDLGGVLPDDQRRGGSFTWPPPCEGYVPEGLQGATVQAELLSRAGYNAWGASNNALLRAYTWLYQNGCVPSGDDASYVLLANHAYGADFRPGSGGAFGKNMGWLPWTRGS